MLGLLRPGVVRPTTKLIVEEEAQVEPLVAEAVIESTSDVGLCMFVEHNRLSLACLLGDFLAIRAILQQVVLIELRITILGVDASKLYHIECTIRMTYLVNLCTTHYLCLIAIEVDYLIGVVRKIECGLPLKVLGLEIGRVDFQFHTLISQLSYVHEVRAETCGHRHRTVHEKVLGVTQIILQGNVHTIEEREVET